MKRKLFVFLPSIIMIVICSSIVFSTSSKVDIPPPESGTEYCSDLNDFNNWNTVNCDFSFNQNANMSLYRTPNFINYVPLNDIRRGTLPSVGGGSLSQYGTNYFCEVTVTAVPCNKSWVRAMDPTNIVTSNRMQIKMPPPNQTAVKVTVRYYEVSETQTLGTPDFNQLVGYISSKRLRYTFEHTYPNGTDYVSAVLSPSNFHVFPGEPLQNTGGLTIHIDDEFDPLSGKTPLIDDYNGVNEFIDANGL